MTRGPAPPPRFGKYEIVATLGAGAMGVVYLAYDPSIDRKVALKTIRKDLLDGKQAATLVARFRQEAIAAGRLSHPGIVAVYDYGEDESTAFIVMEYAPGEELGSHAERRALAFPEIAALMAELLDALQYAHDAGVIHRDIKPSNLIVCAGADGSGRPGRLKITDFGIARLASSTITQHGTAIGTPSYMAPEQYAGGFVDHRSDLFAAGVLFYELLTRRLPFDGATLQHVAYQICHVEPTPPSALVPHLPRGVDATVARALAKSADDRFRSARDFAAAIAGTLGHAAPPHAPPLNAARPPPAFASGSDATLKGWTQETLRLLEATLAPAVGAVAGPLVRRSAARTTDPEQLAVLLSASLDDSAARTRLLHALRTVLGAPPSLATPVATTARTPARTIGEQMRGFTPEDLARISQALAAFLGPIAKILVQKASTNASSYRDLCLRVSERLTTPEERARFLAQVDPG